VAAWARAVPKACLGVGKILACAWVCTRHGWHGRAGLERRLCAHARSITAAWHSVLIAVVGLRAMESKQPDGPG
jgi:hypothetical protein